MYAYLEYNCVSKIQINTKYKILLTNWEHI